MVYSYPMNFLWIVATLPSYFWAQSGLILACTAIAGIVVRKALGRLSTAASLPEWLRALCQAFFHPSIWLVWGYGILLFLQVLAASTDVPLPIHLIAKLRYLFFVIFSFWILLRWKGSMEETLINRAKKRASATQDQALIQALGRVLTFFLFFVLALILLDIFDVQLTALLAFGGIGGVAIGFAAKDIVANFFGGLMIHLNRHFAVGEWILSPNKHFEGVVEDIGWYMTRIRTFARRPTFIPNAAFIDAVIENPGRMYNRRIKESFGVRYDDAKKIDSIIKDIRHMLTEHPAIDQSKALFVHLMGFGTSSLDVEVYCFTKTTDWQQWRDVQQDVLLKIVDLVAAHGAQMAFPTATVHIPQSEKSLQDLDGVRF